MDALQQFFHLPHIWLLAMSVAAAGGSCMLMWRGRRRVALWLLWAASAGLNVFMALLDPFLHNWDERYHALVARNMMDHPFTPILRAAPLMPFNKFDWCCSHIWLHKQPLFLWQMALSMKVFGVSELAMRLPSVLMASLTVMMVYSVGKSVLGNQRLAFFAALMMCFCNYSLELVSGFNGTDHNNVAFICYVLASIWAYTQYSRHSSWLWVLLIGVFAGCAVLNKWLVGMVVFGAWSLNLLLAAKDKDTGKQVVHLLVAIAISCAVFMPWQLYIAHAFPDVAAYEYNYNSRHITEVIEGHKGKILYYLRQLPVYFGWPGMLLLPLGFGLVARSAVRHKNASRPAIALLSVTAVIFLFFSLVVKTKWPPYLAPIVPLGFILVAAAVQWCCAGKMRYMTAVMAVCVIAAFNPFALGNAHSMTNRERVARMHNAAIYRHLKNYLSPGVKIVLNTPSFEDLDAMFYNKDLNVNAWMLSPQVIDSLEQAHVPFAVFKAHGNYGIPANVTSYPQAFIIDKELE